MSAASSLSLAIRLRSCSVVLSIRSSSPLVFYVYQRHCVVVFDASLSGTGPAQGHARGPSSSSQSSCHSPARLPSFPSLPTFASTSSSSLPERQQRRARRALAFRPPTHPSRPACVNSCSKGTRDKEQRQGGIMMQRGETGRTSSSSSSSPCHFAFADARGAGG